MINISVPRPFGGKWLTWRRAPGDLQKPSPVWFEVWPAHLARRRPVPFTFFFFFCLGQGGHADLIPDQQAVRLQSSWDPNMLTDTLLKALLVRHADLWYLTSDLWTNKHPVSGPGQPVSTNRVLQLTQSSVCRNNQPNCDWPTPDKIAVIQLNNKKSKKKKKKSSLCFWNGFSVSKHDLYDQ